MAVPFIEARNSERLQFRIHPCGEYALHPFPFNVLEFVQGFHWYLELHMLQLRRLDLRKEVANRAARVRHPETIDEEAELGVVAEVDACTCMQMLYIHTYKK